MQRTTVCGVPSSHRIHTQYNSCPSGSGNILERGRRKIARVKSPRSNREMTSLIPPQYVWLNRSWRVVPTPIGTLLFRRKSYQGQPTDKELCRTRNFWKRKIWLFIEVNLLSLVSIMTWPALYVIIYILAKIFGLNKLYVCVFMNLYKHTNIWQ